MDQINVFAETDFRNQKTKFGIKINDRRRHVYIVGKTGTGKTTLLENMAIQDIQKGSGVAIVDPHGEFAEKMLDFVPSGRINDVIYFNPADLEYPIAFNVLEKVSAEYRHLVASGLMGVFKKIWPDVWSARMEYILNNAVLALLEYQGSTLLGINKILADKDFRDRVVEKLTDPSVKSFWVNEFAKYPDRFREEAVAPIQNKIGQFISSPLIRNIIGQTRSSIDFRDVMDSGKILVVNLSKGRIGEDASRLLGALCITKLQLAAMSRVDAPEELRRDFFLYVDEFQNFATESFANILSEARKYRLCLILAHQYIDQLVQGENTTVKEAIFGNVGTMISFRVGAADAEFLEKEFEPEFSMNDLVNLGFAQVYLKLMIDGFSSRPFSATTLPPLFYPEKSHRDKIIRVSRERYAGLTRKEIEEKIARWSGVPEETQESKKEALPSGGQSRPGGGNQPKAREGQFSQIFVEPCWECGRKVEFNFRPDKSRPVLCDVCLNQKVKESRSDSSNSKDFGRVSGQAGKSRPTADKPAFAGATADKPAFVKTAADKPAGLSEAPGREADGNKNSPSAKKPRREIDLSGLRDVLKEVMAPAPEKNPPVNAILRPAVQENKNQGGNNPSGNFSQAKEMKAGETVEFK